MVCYGVDIAPLMVCLELQTNLLHSHVCSKLTGRIQEKCVTVKSSEVRAKGARIGQEVCMSELCISVRVWPWEACRVGHQNSCTVGAKSPLLGHGHASLRNSMHEATSA